MITYKAMYKFLDEGGVHGQVLDFPGAITCGETLEETRRLLGSALEELAELSLLDGKPLPLPNPKLTHAEADLEEPIYLLFRAGSQLSVDIAHKQKAFA